MGTHLDLKQLAIRRESSAPSIRRRSPVFTRYVLPAAILVGFAAVAAWATRDRFLPRHAVTVVPVLTSAAEVQQAGTPLFQSAGWVEPRPTPIIVTALSEGVVEKLLVVEGDRVAAGQPVARLIEADARLSLQTAEADLKQRQAERAAAQAALAAAGVNLEKPVQLRAALAESEAMLAQKETELAALPFQLRAAEAKARLARTTHDLRKQAAQSGAVPQLNLDQAVSELESAAADVEALRTRDVRLRREVEAQREKREALKLRLELKTDEVRTKADAEALLLGAAARVLQAETAVETARLRLDRMTVRAPADGRVWRLVASPGSRLMGQNAAGEQNASTVVVMFDPARLQVRADVRLEDVPRVRPGQPVRIETPAAPGGPMDGEVLFPTSQTDIQKNTLQVKVAIKNPPATIHPDMLVQVTFLAPPSASPSPETGRLRLLVPRSLVESGEGGAKVWVADLAEGVARRKAVKLGAVAGELVEVTEGLTPADRLIAGGRDGLEDRTRIHVTGEEASPAAAPQRKHDPAKHKGGA